MKLEHLFLPTRQTRSIDLLSQACFWLGIEVTRLLPGEEHQLPLDCSLANAAVHGGSSFCRTVAQFLGGKVLEPEDSFLPNLPAEYLRRRVQMMPLSAARILDSPSFVKPVNDKHFPSAVYASGKELPNLHAHLDVPVLVADPVQWEGEFRMFIREDAVWTSSAYALPGTPSFSSLQHEQAREFCEQLLADDRIVLPGAIVLDVGWIKDGGWAVVEANTAVMSAIYDCDPGAVLEVVRYGISNAHFAA